MTDQPDLTDHDDEDVDACLDRETEDGPGTDNLDALPDEDFESFAEDGVEQEATK